MATKRNTENNISFSNATGAAPARRKTVSKPRAKAAASSEPATVIESAETTSVSLAAPLVAPSREAIAELAYSFWAARGYQGGSEVEDWLRAEHELRAASSN